MEQQQVSPPLKVMETGPTLLVTNPSLAEAIKNLIKTIQVARKTTYRKPRPLHWKAAWREAYHATLTNTGGQCPECHDHCFTENSLRCLRCEKWVHSTHYHLDADTTKAGFCLRKHWAKCAGITKAHPKDAPPPKVPAWLS